MLNEERIKVMTKIAAYEANQGKKNVAIGSYFRGDYISLQVIKSIISWTIAFLLFVLLCERYDLEIFMHEIYKTDFVQFGKRILIIYLVFIAVYAGVSYIVYTFRYSKARKSLKNFYNNLKKLSVSYTSEAKRERQQKEGF